MPSSRGLNPVSSKVSQTTNPVADSWGKYDFSGLGDGKDAATYNVV